MNSMVMWEHTSKSYGEIHEGIVDNKNRVLSLHPKLGTDYIGMYHEPKLGS